MRGDGCSGLTLKYGNNEEERDAIWRASMCGQNGRSATLTAPNGLAQEEVILKCFREGKMTPPESCVWSCHGTGTSLGDPIEVNAVRKVNIKHERETSLIVLTNKTHTGHLEGGAAMTSMLAAVLTVKCSTAIPINHFNQLNPHLENSQFDAFFNTEPNSYKYAQGHAQVSSFGFGGTNGHVIFWGQNCYDAPNVPAMVARKLRGMAPPEVRVNGTDPDEWEYDGPEATVKSGDKYKVTLNSTDPKDASVKWVKEAEEEEDDGEDDFYCITGPFTEWDTDRMAEGPVTGMHTISVQVPDSGVLEFRFVKNGDEEDTIYPMVDKCTRKTTPIFGPGKETCKNLHMRNVPEEGSEKNTWVVETTPGSFMKIDLFICRGMKSVSWCVETEGELSTE